MEIAWVGMPEPTKEQIEGEVVSLITAVIEWKKRNDRPGAKWKIGTTQNAFKRINMLPDCQPAQMWTSWMKGCPQEDALELIEYHGMKIDGDTHEIDTEIYAYTDRYPKKDEIRQRAKEPLTVKQKRMFRIIKEYVACNGHGPTKRDLMRIAGHRSPTTTYGFLGILSRKNWIIVERGRHCIEIT